MTFSRLLKHTSSWVLGFGWGDLQYFWENWKYLLFLSIWLTLLWTLIQMVSHACWILLSRMLVPSKLCFTKLGIFNDLIYSKSWVFFNSIFFSNLLELIIGERDLILSGELALVCRFIFGREVLTEVMLPFLLFGLSPQTFLIIQFFRSHGLFSATLSIIS